GKWTTRMSGKWKKKGRAIAQPCDGCGSQSPLRGSGIQKIRGMIYAANISSRLPSAASAFYI
ncbi:hypothetical protein AWI62_22905, partial [Salmonella enterica]|nr:hypothetical protein [Salmonella enterica]